MHAHEPVFDPKAVIEGRPPGGHRAGLIAVIVLAAFCAIIVLGIDVLQSVATGRSVVPFLVALPFALAPVPLLVAAVLLLDRLEPEPRANLTLAFLWGAGVAALLAVVINTAGMQYVTQPALGATSGEYVSATAGAPVVEESLKGLVLVGLLRWRRQELDGPTDGVIYAAMVGLGFAMTENIGYYMGAFVSPAHGGVRLLAYTFVLRGVLSPLLHPIFTSMTGLGAAYTASHRHAGWALPLGWLAAILQGVLVLILAVLVADRRKVVRLITRFLPGYAPTGLVTQADVRMLSTLRGRRRARSWARSAGGLPAAAAMGDYQLAATELALLHQKAERGVISPVRFAARQQALLALMRRARGEFLRRRAQPPPAPWAVHGGSGFTRPAAPAAPVALPAMPQRREPRRPGRRSSPG